MNHHDPQRTGRSQFVGPRIGTIDWIIDSVAIMSSISIGTDSSIYLPSQSAAHLGFYSYTPGGALKWKLGVNEGLNFSYNVSTPLVARDGTVLFAGGLSGKVFSINSNGSLKWVYQAQNNIYQTGMNIGLDGTFYLITTGKDLIAIDANGNAKWAFNYSDFFSNTSSVISFSPDGKTLYIPGISNSLYSFDINTQTINWFFGDGTLYAAPIVDNEGNIYIQSKDLNYNNGKNTLFCLKPDGGIKWAYSHNNPQMDIAYLYAEGTIDKYGNSYFAFDTLYSVSYDGKLNWKLALDGYVYTPLICDAENVIYVSVLDKNAFYSIKEIVAINNKGEYLWRLPISNNYPEDVGGLSPAIDETNRLYIPTWEQQRFFVIK